MSAKITLGSTIGGLVLLIIIGVVVITGSKANEEAAIQAANDSESARIQSEKNNQDIQSINQTLHHFVDMWTDRIKIGNNNTNTTQKLIVDTQENILHNLTEHRNVTNQTRDVALNLTREIARQNDLIIELLNNQSELINKNSTDEHQIIIKGLNLSKKDTHTASFDAIQKLKKQLDALENQQTK